MVGSPRGSVAKSRFAYFTERTLRCPHYKILRSDYSEAIGRAVGIDNGLLAFRAFDALPVLHAEHALETS